ncbi:MAG: Gfo/Idh/MocA family oxidoreductase [Candidatus Solibacter sp.]
MAQETRQLRVAVIGAGMIANAAHIPAWKDQPGVQVVGVADRSRDAAAATASRHGIPHWYEDPGRMLAELELDAVTVCTPPRSHREYVIAALQAGAHVLCEKPLAAASFADARAMFDAAKLYGRALLVGQSMRFYSQIAAARQFAASGELGKIYYGEAARLRRRGAPRWGAFHRRSDSGGGPLLDLGVHVLDALLWILGNPRVIAASAMTCRELLNREEEWKATLADSGAPIGTFDSPPPDFRDCDVEDMGAGFLRLENGAAVTLRASWAANVPDSVGGMVMAMGTEGGLFLDPRVPELKVVKNIAGYQVDISPKLPPPDPSHPFYAHWKEVAHFVRVIRGDEEPLVRREEALNVMRALEAMYRSAAEGREVRIDVEDRIPQESLS